MTWLDVQPGFERRPLVCVEDHLYHTTEMLEAISDLRPDLVAQCTVCCLDREGPDTTTTVDTWRQKYPGLQVAARGAHGAQSLPIDSTDLRDLPSAARLIARLLRPSGILVQDVQLTTLPFIPPDRWWESIYVSSTIRGMFGRQAPTVRFLSNKRGYSATFGRDLADAGFDPRDVMDKAELRSVVVATLASLVDRAFPRWLESCTPPHTHRRDRLTTDDEEQRTVERAVDLVVWPAANAIELGGRVVSGENRARVSIKSPSHEATTWRALVDDFLEGGEGLEVVRVGERIGPPDADRAELTNLAARHIHTLRGRLSAPTAIVTASHRYRLREGLSVAIARDAAG